jgi:GNAT superfamily N-acetyltransferase
VKLEFRPLTPGRWNDFEGLFGERGACGGCWCMWWKLTRSEFEAKKGAKNKAAMKRIVQRGEKPGLLAYDGRKPIGWCAVAPRLSYPSLSRSRILKPVDDEPVWSITCFFVHKDYRKKGVSVKLLREARRFVAKQGGKTLEGYPTAPRKEMPDTFAWHGVASAFERAGFKECARRSESRPIMRATAMVRK